MRHIEIIDSLRQERVGLTHAEELNELEATIEGLVKLAKKPTPKPKNTLPAKPSIRQTAATQRTIETLSRGFDLLLQVVSGKPVRKTTLTEAINRAKEAQRILKS